MSLVLGVRGCQHLGYAAAGMRLNKATRWNQRIVDGHYAHRATMESMLEHGVDGIVDGGDLTHWNKPLPRDIELANRVDDLRAAANIWGIGNSGNHCAGGGTDISAMAMMHRPTLGMHTIHPDPSRRSGGVGPHPGLYEIHDQSTIAQIPDGIALHLVSHYGLSRHLASAGITIDPQPIPGKVNVLFAHGTFAADERLFHCLNPHGEERPIPPEWAKRGWEAVLLSHYHSLGPIPGFDEQPRGQVWYTGSALRRGFSDDAGTRGWLKVTLDDSQPPRIETVPIWQRPQHDLPVIDADGLSAADIDDLVTAHLAAIELTDDVSARHTGDPGAIVRQRLTGTTPAQRTALRELKGRYLNLTAGAAWWSGLTYDHCNDPSVPNHSAERELASAATDFSADLRGRFNRISGKVGISNRRCEPVLAKALTWTDQVSAPPSAEPNTSARHTAAPPDQPHHGASPGRNAA